MRWTRRVRRSGCTQGKPSSAAEQPIVWCPASAGQNFRRLHMATATDARLQAKTISPTLTVNNIQQSVKFFEGLGFGVEERWEENGTLLGVMLRAGDRKSVVQGKG